MQKLYYYFEGGLGDVIIQYYKDPHLSGLAEYRRGAQAYVRAILNVHNAQAFELFRFHSGIDEVQFVSFQPHLRDEIHADLKEEGFVRAGEKVERSAEAPVIFLSAQDNEYLRKLLPPKPLILFHPGSGKADFSLLGKFDFLPLFDAAEQAGAAVVMVGGPSARLIQGQSPQLLTELGFPEHPALVNLVGVANPRLVCDIARQCTGFIGTLSCYLWAAAHHRKPGICFIPAGFRDDYVTNAANAGMSVMSFDEIRGDASFDQKMISKCMRMLKAIWP